MIVESVKLADDGSGDVIVRIYEAQGARKRTMIRAGFATTGVCAVDLLERRLDDLEVTLDDGLVAISLRPFQILTLRFIASGRGEA